ncbi:hypothetical protein [Caballeronia sp. ATUFL_M1_KS5A]|uniref:hypothetical protein n=1 Tax=Caballeronia sp. ATUFL_M1_KS5A TaxID=2921778 RepID=UPI00202910E8|nr:hypothetical protein [Caballeronia sp. ATUFL_M1_KS5A]
MIYFVLIELSLISYLAGISLDLDITMTILSSLQTVFGLVMESVFVKKLAATPR